MCPLLSSMLEGTTRCRFTCERTYAGPPRNARTGMDRIGRGPLPSSGQGRLRAWNHARVGVTHDRDARVRVYDRHVQSEAQPAGSAANTLPRHVLVADEGPGAPPLTGRILTAIAHLRSVTRGRSARRPSARTALYVQPHAVEMAVARRFRRCLAREVDGALPSEPVSFVTMRAERSLHSLRFEVRGPAIVGASASSPRAQAPVRAPQRMQRWSHERCGSGTGDDAPSVLRAEEP